MKNQHQPQARHHYLGNSRTGFIMLLFLHWLGRVVKWLHLPAGPLQLGGGTASEWSLSHTWTWRDLRGVGVGRRAPGGVAVRWGFAIAVLCFQSAGSSAVGNKTSFNPTLAGGWFSTQKLIQALIMENTATPSREKWFLQVKFIFSRVLFLISPQGFSSQQKVCFIDKWNADRVCW